MPENSLLLEPGSLWTAIENRTKLALESGVMRPIETESETLMDQGVAFNVRVVSTLARKAHETNPDAHPPDFDPFLPYEQSLFVADISTTHVAVLNKFPVVDNHLLIITKVFEEQTSLLTPADFQALWACMREFDGLAFYNAGRVAGASQRHKHLQLVPLFLDGLATPIDHAMAGADLPDGVGMSPMLPFRHAIASLGALRDLPISDASGALQEYYGSMLRYRNMAPLPDNQRNYNLLVTRRWMMLVPRSREHFQGISVNALAFAGELLVMDHDQLATLREHGPMAALTAVSE